MESRLLTGVPGMDELLDGGMLPGRTVLLKGTPGTGKTTLGLQMLIAGALEYDEPGIFLTFEQVRGQLFEDAMAYGWDLKALDEESRVKVFFIEPDEVLDKPGRQSNRLLVNLADYVDEFESRRVLIDSISHLHTLFSAEEARASFMKFITELKVLGLTPIMTAEMQPTDGLAGLDAYLVDTLIQLHIMRGGDGRPERRVMEIVKTRGHKHVGGQHPMEFGPRGIRVFPHTYHETHAHGLTGADDDDSADLAAPTPTHRVRSGVEGLDDLLGGGYLRGSTILVAGLSGTFKTTMGAHFLLSGADDAPPSLWLTFLDTVAELDATFASEGMDLAAAREAGRLIVLEAIPGAEPVEKLLLQIEALVESRGIERVLIDSMDELGAGLLAEEHHEAVRWFARRLTATGVTTLITQRLARVTGRNPLSEIKFAELVDTIIYLGLVEIESRLEKVISVLKHRGGAVQGDLRSIIATENGLKVSERFLGLSGVLEGTPLGRRKAQIEEIFQPLYFIRDFLQMAKDPAMDPEQRTSILGNLHNEANSLIALMSRYFDQPLEKSPRTVSKSEEGKE